MKLKQLFPSALLALILLPAAVSCLPQDSPEEPSLALSAESLLVSDEGGDAGPITVTTNQARVTVIAQPQEWLSATLSGQDIKVSATPNLTGAERRGAVLVFAGGLVKQVAVTQTSAETEPHLEADPALIEAPAKGTKELVRIVASADNWEIENPDAVTWVAIRLLPGMAELTIAPNETGEARATKLFVKLGGAVQEIEIRQADGINGRYGMPLFLMDRQASKVIEYEESMGNVLHEFVPGGIKFDESANAYVNDPTIIGFDAFYDVFSYVEYKYAFPSNVLESVQMFTTTGAKDLALLTYLPYLRSKGFEIAGDPGEQEYTLRNRELQIRADIYITRSPEDEYSHVLFTPYFEEPDYETFDTFPYEQGLQFIDTPYDKDRLKAALEKQGYDLTQDLKVSWVLPDFAEYADQSYSHTYTSKDPESVTPMQVHYFLWEKDMPKDRLGLVQQSWYFRTDVEKVYWQNKKGEWNFTSAFRRLAKDNGFEVLKDGNPANAVFFKKAEGRDDYLILGTQVMQFAGVNDGKPLLLLTWKYGQVKP